MRAPVEGDLRWLWAAYRMGVWPEHLLRAGIEPGEFRDEIEHLLIQVPIFEVLVGPTSKGHAPVGLALGLKSEHRIQPEFLWFPWASARNRLELGIAFFRLAAREHLAIVWAREADRPYFERLVRYGVLRCRGQVPAFFARDEPAMLYFTRMR